MKYLFGILFTLLLISLTANAYHYCYTCDNAKECSEPWVKTTCHGFQGTCYEEDGLKACGNYYCGGLLKKTMVKVKNLYDLRLNKKLNYLLKLVLVNLN